MATATLPDSIERQLLTLDRQVRDATFSRGISRLALIVPLVLGIFLALDWIIGLGTSLRFGLLAVWLTLTVAVLWREVLRPLFRPPSLAELAALVERQHPELKERLTSLVELQHHDAPGASPVMRELLARQTSRVVEQIDLTDAAPAIRSPGTALLAMAALLLVLCPFAFFPADYGLLWARLFAPWGNFQWGSTQLVVIDGDRVVAKGSDVPIQVELHSRRKAAQPDVNQQTVWLHWTDDVGIEDSRRLERDVETGRFATTLPRVTKGLKFHATTSDARSQEHQIRVADPPVIASLRLQIDPPAYTGLPAQTLDGAEGEVRAVERSRVTLAMQFSESVEKAELVWPIPLEAATGDAAATQAPKTERVIPLRMASDQKSASVEALALASGPFAIRIRNRVGLGNTDPARSLVIDPDLPPAISLDGTEEPISIRPDDRHAVTAQIQDDYGLAAVELHLETSTGIKRVIPVPADGLKDRSITREFAIDAADFELTPGQAITYRVHAVDNRPIPAAQETWTRLRTLMIEVKSADNPDKELADRQQDLSDQIEQLRKELAENKQSLQELHQKTEDESLKQKNSDKSEELAKLEQKQADLSERLRQLAAELDERELTEKLAERVQQLADQDLADARKKLQQAAQGESRDQLQPLSQAIDKLSKVDKALQAIDQQLAELNRLEKDLQQLEQLARNTDRLAEQLDQLDQQSRDSADQKSDQVDSQPLPPNGEKPADLETPPAAAKVENESAAAEREQQRKKLNGDAQKLSQDLAELLKKHPELLDAARRDQQQRLEDLARQADELAKPQERLARAFERAAEDAPASAQRPSNETAASEKNELEAAANADGPGNNVNQPADPDSGNADRKPDAVASPPQGKAPASGDQEVEGAEKAVRLQQRLAQDAIRQALELAQQDGLDSKATKAATDFARQAADAARQAETGDLKQAARQGQQAAEAASQAEKELSNPAVPADPRADRAGELARQQRELSEELDQLSKSEAAQQAAQKQGQRQLADAAQALSEQLEQAARNLETAPLNAQRSAEAASKARQATDDAQRAMRQAFEAAQAEDPQRAAEQAGKAAQQLQQAAQEAQRVPQQPESNPAVPEELGTRVAQAAQQLKRAQDALSTEPQAGQPQAGQPQAGQPQAGQPQAGQPQAGQPQAGQPQAGQPQAGQPQAGQPQAGQPQAGQSQAGQSQAGQPQAGQSQAGQSQAGQPQAGQPQAGQPQAGQPQAGQPQAGGADQGTPSANGTLDGDSKTAPPKPGMSESGQPGGQPAQAGPDGSGDEGEPGASPQKEPPSALAQSAEQFRRAADLLRRAARQNGDSQGPGKPGQQPGPASGDLAEMAGDPGEPGEPVQPGGAAGTGAGNESDADLKQLEGELKKHGQRNWGKLPGQLRTEILQGANKKPRPEYARQIKSYFEEIAKPATRETLPPQK